MKWKLNKIPFDAFCMKQKNKLSIVFEGYFCCNLVEMTQRRKKMFHYLEAIGL